MYHTIGRSMKRMVQIKLKAVSADHAKIGYAQDKGWFITEKGKDKLSSNGTFVFMKSLSQIAEHQPSDMIPLHDGMVISFINYELRVNLEKKDPSVIAEQDYAIRNKLDELAQSSANLASTLKAQQSSAVVEEKAESVHIEEEKPQE